MSLTVAFVGTGDPEAGGFAMSYLHAKAFDRREDCYLVACTDIVERNAGLFADEYDIHERHVFTDHEEMLAAVDPDIVSVCVPPAAHADVVIDCIRTGLEAVHCEKPMALTLGGARRMTEEARRFDVQLTFNHQRRFAPPYVRAKTILDDGEIGSLRRIELSPPNLFDWGTHLIDLGGWFNDERPPDWAIGQIDYREENLIFGAHNENQAYGLWQYDNGVFGVISTGEGSDLVPSFLRLVGTEGVIEVDPESTDDYLRYRQNDGAWEYVAYEDYRWTDPIGPAIEHVVTALDTDEPSPLRAGNALNATEIIFGIWESARRCGRVEFPLDIEDNPLEAMVKSGTLDPVPGKGAGEGTSPEDGT